MRNSVTVVSLFIVLLASSSTQISVGGKDQFYAGAEIYQEASNAVKSVDDIRMRDIPNDSDGITTKISETTKTTKFSMTTNTTNTSKTTNTTKIAKTAKTTKIAMEFTDMANGTPPAVDAFHATTLAASVDVKKTGGLQWPFQSGDTKGLFIPKR
ncbi:hypothetical protein Aperf_G00000058165 [Anoplocephala perfoliata]